MALPPLSVKPLQNQPTLNPRVQSQPTGLPQQPLKVSSTPMQQPKLSPGVFTSPQLSQQPQITPGVLPQQPRLGIQDGAGNTPTYSASLLEENNKQELATVIARMEELQLPPEQIKQVVEGYIRDNMKTPEQPPEPEKSGNLFTDLVEGAVKTPLSLFEGLNRLRKGGDALLKSAGNKLIGNEEGAEYRLNEAGNILNPEREESYGTVKVKPPNIRFLSDPDVTTGDVGRDVLREAGRGIELGSYGIGATGIGQVVKQTLKGKVIQGAIQGAKYETAAGLVGGLGVGLQEEDATVKSVLISTLVGGLGGGLLGGLLGGGAPLAGRAIRPAVEKVFPGLRIQRELDEFAGIVDDAYAKAFKPTTGTKMTEAQLEKQLEQNRLGVALVLDSLPKDADGKIIADALPDSVSATNKATSEAKKNIFSIYNKMAKERGEEGLRIDLSEIADNLEKLANDPRLDIAPGTADYARRLSQTFRERGIYDPLQTQDVLAGLNESLAAFYRNPDPNAIRNVMVNSYVANSLRKALNEGISGLDNTVYRDLRIQYGALEQMERAVTRRTAQILKQSGSTLIGDLANIVSGEEIIRGIITFNPKALATGIGVKTISNLFKRARDPDRIATKMFRKAGAIFNDVRDKVIPPRNYIRTKFPTALPKGTGETKVNVPINLPDKPIVTNSASQTQSKLRRVGGRGSRRTNQGNGIGKKVVTKNPRTNQMFSAVGGTAGVEQDENGNVTIDSKKALAGVALGALGMRGVGSKTGRELLERGIKNGLPAPKKFADEVSNNQFNVGLSAVRGHIDQFLDKLADEASSLLAKGDEAGAQKLFDQINNQAGKVLQNKFKGTNIKIKMRGVGFGVYKGTPEPNLDFTATVPPRDIDLFHKILTDLSQDDFAQKSFLTYRSLPDVDNAKLGIVDKAKGISNEPYIQVQLAKPLKLTELEEMNKALEEAGLEYVSLKEGNKTIDLLNITNYNNDYDKFIQQATDFYQNLNRKGFQGELLPGVKETRFIGIAEDNPTATYERSRSSFYKENKDFARPEETNSKVIQAISYQNKISKKSLQSIVNSGDVSPLEKQVFKEVLDQLGDGDIKPIRVQGILRSKLLEISPEYRDSWTGYGWENIGMDRYDEDKEFLAMVMNTKVKHGSGQGHYKDEGIFGHVRAVVTDENKVKVAKIGEVQSDFFQDNDNIASFKETPPRKRAVRETIGKMENARYVINRTKERLDLAEKSKVYYKDLTTAIAKQMKKRNLNPSDYEMMSVREDGKGSLVRLWDNPNNEYANVVLPRFKYNSELYYAPDIEVSKLPLQDFLEKSDKYIDTAIAQSESELKQATKDQLYLGELLEKQKALTETTDIQEEQFINFARKDKYRDRTLEEGINELINKHGVEEIHIATPSTVAKIEWNLGEGNAYYDYLGGTAVRQSDADLGVGERIEYGGEDYTIVKSDSYNFEAAPTNKVNSFTLDDYVQDEVDSELYGDAKYVIKRRIEKNGEETITVKELLEEGNLPWNVEKVIEKTISEDRVITLEDLDEFLNDITDDVQERIYDNAEDSLRDIYGRDNVFFESDRRLRTTVTVVDEDISPESFPQPSEIEGGGLDDKTKFDKDREYASEIADRKQMGVLENYYKIQEEWIPKWEKDTGLKAEIIEDDNGNTWIKIKAKKIKKTVF